MSEKARLHCRPGRLVWGRLRNAVKEAKWRGHTIDLMEGSGWFVRDFWFVGDAEAIRLVAQVVRDIEDEAHAARMAAGI